MLLLLLLLVLVPMLCLRVESRTVDMPKRLSNPESSSAAACCDAVESS
jgi:hypothetical protein